MIVFRWIADRIKDLLYDPTNSHLDAGRVAAWLTIGLLVWAVAHNIHLKGTIDLAALAAGETALLGALQFYLYHDRKTNGGQ